MTDVATGITPILVALLKGVVDREANAALWELLALREGAVRDYLRILGLDLHLDDTEGFAFVKQHEPAEGEPEIPRLVQRRSLSYPVSLLCVILRKRLAEADHSGEVVRVIVHRDEIMNDMRVYLKDQTNEARVLQQVESAVTKVMELGFLKEQKEPLLYEIRRIVKALVDADWLVDLQAKLETYAEQSGAIEREGGER